MAVLVAALIAALPCAVEAQGSRWGEDYVPNLPVVTQDGKVLRFYDDLIKNKIVVISFIFTSCKDICPLATARMAQVQEKLGDRVGRDIFLYSISVDPENDTPDKLKGYADAFQASPGWLFLTGAPEDIKEIRWKLGERSRRLGEHRNDLMLGNGTTGEWGRDSAMGDLDRLILVINQMDPNWRHEGPTVVPGAGGQGAGGGAPRVVGHEVEFKIDNENPGEALFVKACAGCHSIGRGDRVGPDLDGLTARRKRTWITEFIMSPQKMRAKKDPIALALTAKFPTVPMPSLQMSESDASDLIAFIERRQTTRPEPLSLDPLFALTTHEGRRFSRQALNGRPLAVAFGFTHCPDVCPTTLLDWSNVLTGLGRDADRLQVLFIAVDTERDTPAALKSYMSSFDPRIVALTGSKAQVAEAAQAFGAFYERIEGKDGSVSYDHTVKTYLVDHEGRLAGAVDLHGGEAERRALLARLLADKPIAQRQAR
jgi:protein SCO1/2